MSSNPQSPNRDRLDELREQPINSTSQWSREMLVKLRKNLRNSFNDSELRDLCFDLGVDYGSLGGAGTGDKARELVAYLGRRGRISELVEACKQRRRNVAWGPTPPERRPVKRLEVITERIKSSGHSVRKITIVLTLSITLLAFIGIAIFFTGIPPKYAINATHTAQAIALVTGSPSSTSMQFYTRTATHSPSTSTSTATNTPAPILTPTPTPTPTNTPVPPPPPPPPLEVVPPHPAICGPPPPGAPAGDCGLVVTIQWRDIQPNDGRIYLLASVGGDVWWVAGTGIAPPDSTGQRVIADGSFSQPGRIVTLFACQTNETYPPGRQLSGRPACTLRSSDVFVQTQ